MGTRFSARPDRPWSTPSLLYNGYRVFPGGKVRPGRAADHPPPSSAAIMEEKSYTSAHPMGHTGPVTGTLYLYLLLNSPHLLRSYKHVNLRLTKTQMPLQYLHSSACSRTCFLYEVSHSVPVLACLPLSQENRYSAGKPIKKYFRKEHLHTTTSYYNKKEPLSLIWK